MGERYIMGLDLGGSGGRCMLLSVDSGRIITAYRSWTHPVLPGTGGFGFDLDIDDVWQKLGHMTKDALARAGASAEAVLGIAATCMRHGIVVIDRDGKPLMASPAIDARAAIEGLTLGMERGREFVEGCGHWPCPVFAAPRLMWMASNIPGSLARAKAFFAVSDWVAYVLTGEIAMEQSLAQETMMLGLKTRAWAYDIIDSLKLPHGIFPVLKNAGERLGSLTQTAAEHLGLKAGTPVAVGGGDTQSGLLGAGIIEAQEIGVIAGSTVAIQMVVNRPVVDPECKLWTGQHLIPGLWVVESNAGAMGDTVDMFARILYPDVQNAVEMLMTEAMSASPGANGMISTLGCQVFNGSDLGVPVGHLALSHINMKKGSGRPDLARSILEGLAFAIRANIAEVKRVSGHALKDLKLAGGMSQSSLWAQILSDVLEVPVKAAEPHATALGAAICAGVGAGIFKDLSEGAGRFTRVVREYTPQRENAERYKALYVDWHDLLAPLKQVDAKAGSIILNAVMSQPDPPARPCGEIFRPRILVTAEMDDASRERLQAIGEVEFASYREMRRLLIGDDLVQALQGMHIFVTEVDVIDARVLSRLPDLRVIVVCRGDPVNVDVKAASLFGIPVINTPGRNAQAVADLAVAFMLMLARRFPAAGEFLHAPGGEEGDMGRIALAHDRFIGSELWGKTIGLIGMGAVGRETAKRLRAFGVRLIVFDPYITPEKAILAGAHKVSLDKLLAESDIISLHAPVTDETRCIINADTIARMKPGAYLINTARAALIDDDALFEGLQTGKIGGVALDVFTREPPASDDPLLTLPNVIATPHLGGNTVELAAHQGEMVGEAVARIMHGEKPDHVLNPEVLAGFRWDQKCAPPTAVEIEQLVRTSSAAVTDLEAQARKGEKTPNKAATGAKIEYNLSPLRDHMARLLQSFVGKVAADEDLRGFSRGKDVTLHFILTDLGLPFYIAILDDAVKAELADPAVADVLLKMKAFVLDGMFTGSINGMEAALNGQLSFSGDTAKAMTFQQIQKDLMRLYGEAREEVGDPGDLSQIGKTEALEKKSGVQTVSVSCGTPAVITVGDIRDDILKVMNELYAHGLITATGGNVSARIPGRPNEIWISPSHIFKGDLRADMMVRIDINGKPLDPDALQASSERNVHTAIYHRRPEVGAIIHSHPLMTTILDMSDMRFLPISTEAAFIGNIPQVPFIMPGTKELADAVAEELGKGVAVFMKNHGLVVAASSLRRAADMTEVIELSAKIMTVCRTLGVKAPVLPDDIVAILRSVGDMMA